MLALSDGAGGFVVTETLTDYIRNTTGRFPLATADFNGDGNRASASDAPRKLVPLRSQTMLS